MHDSLNNIINDEMLLDYISDMSGLGASELLGMDADEYIRLVDETLES